jgi:hypothetical protein
MFVRALYWSLPQARPPYPISLAFILTFSIHLPLSLHNCLFSFAYPIKNVYAFHSLGVHIIYFADHSLLYVIIIITLLECSIL